MRFKRKLVLVYQMGKVGSSAIEASLGDDAMHLHTIYGGRKWMLRRFENKKIIDRVITFLRLIKLRVEIFFAKDVKIITLVREPHARNMSYFFQRLYVDLNYYYQDLCVDPRKADFDNLYAAFEYNTKRLNNYLFDTWFDNEFFLATKINVFDQKYDPQCGYKIFRKNRTSVFVTRYEDLNLSLPAMEDFIGHSISLSKVNDSEEKWYAPVYREFKSSYKPSQKYMDLLKDTKTYKHFYEVE